MCAAPGLKREYLMYTLDSRRRHVSRGHTHAAADETNPVSCTRDETKISRDFRPDGHMMAIIVKIYHSEGTAGPALRAKV